MIRARLIIRVLLGARLLCRRLWRLVLKFDLLKGAEGGAEGGGY